MRTTIKKLDKKQEKTKKNELNFQRTNFKNKNTSPKRFLAF